MSKRKPKKQSDKATLAEVAKEMAEAEKAKSDESIAAYFGMKS